jgi:DNA repair photolyase
LVTKNTLALRDAEIMASLHRAARFHLIMSITTLDESLARELEPDVPGPAQRLRALAELTKAGVPVSVGLAPILPGINDGEAQLAALFEAAYDHGVEVGFHQPFRMYAATRATLFTYLRSHHPHLLEAYRRLYLSQQDPPRAYCQQLRARIAGLRQRFAARAPVRPPRAAPAGQLAFELND